MISPLVGVRFVAPASRVVPFMTNIISGMFRMAIETARTKACVRTSLGCWHFCLSKSARTKALTTRWPITFSCSVLLMPSMRCCTMPRRLVAVLMTAATPMHWQIVSQSPVVSRHGDGTTARAYMVDIAQCQPRPATVQHHPRREAQRIGCPVHPIAGQSQILALWPW
jgi:hypothetical protein